MFHFFVYFILNLFTDGAGAGGYWGPVVAGESMASVCLQCQYTEEQSLWKLTLYPYELFAEIEDFQFETLSQVCYVIIIQNDSKKLKIFPN